MSMDTSGWSEDIKAWLIDGGSCYAGGLASVEDGVVYSAAHIESCADAAAFSHVYKDDHEEEILQEDESAVKVTINEGQTILQAVKETSQPNGVWIGGLRYRVIQQSRDLEFNGCKFDVVALARSKGGGTLVLTANGSIVIALYDEGINDQNKGNCRVAALGYAEHLQAEGY